MNHIQVPNAREKSLLEDAMKDVHEWTQLIHLLLRLGVNLHYAIGLESFIVSRRFILVRTKANWVVNPLIFNTQQFHERLPFDETSLPFFIQVKVLSSLVPRWTVA